MSYSPWGRRDSDTTEQLTYTHTHTHTHTLGHISRLAGEISWELVRLLKKIHCLPGAGASEGTK